jgi:hypothetical protein
VERAERMVRTRKLFNDWRSSSRVFELTYERLADAGGFAEAVSGIFSEIFGRSPEAELTLVTRRLCRHSAGWWRMRRK